MSFLEAIVDTFVQLTERGVRNKVAIPRWIGMDWTGLDRT